MALHDDAFLEGIYILLNGYTMAVLCFIVFLLHTMKAKYDDRGRKWSRFWKGATYFMLGIGFLISTENWLSVEDIRRMLRFIIAILLWAEISYHIPDVIVCYKAIQRKKKRLKHTKGLEERVS